MRRIVPVETEEFSSQHCHACAGNRRLLKTCSPSGQDSALKKSSESYMITHVYIYNPIGLSMNTLRNLKVLGIAGQKGGVGKTTLATCLAVAGQEDGLKVAIFDIDDQGSASFWPR